MRQIHPDALRSNFDFRAATKLWPGLFLMSMLVTLNTWAPFAFGQQNESAFVTDKLTVGIHGSPNKNSAILKVLPSNSKLSILQTENNFFLVQDETETKGWIERSFVTKTVPVQINFNALESENESLKREIESLQNQHSVANLDEETDEELLKENTSLKGKLSEQKLKTGQLNAEIAKLKSNLKSKSVPPSTKIIELERTLSQLRKEAQNDREIRRELEVRVSDEPSLMLAWIALRHHGGITSAAILTAGLALFLIGFWTCDSLARRRHGGFRL